MVDYPFKSILVADPVTFARAANATVTVYDALDTTNSTPLALKDTSGLPLPNPLTSSADAFLAPFIAQVPDVKLVGGGLVVVETSPEGLRTAAEESRVAAVAAAASAENAATNAGAAAKADIETRVASGQLTGPAGKDGSNVLPTDTAIRDAVNNTASATRGALDTVILNKSAKSPILSTKIKGGNIAPKPGGYAWKGLFGQWDWNNWIKPQVDRAAALGLNAIRLIGAPGAIFTDPWPGNVAKISQETYDARWAQLAEYCLTKNLDLYPCLISKWDVLDVYGLGGNYQDATMTASVKTTAAKLSKYPNVIGFDLFQEGDAHTGVAWTPSTVVPINTYMNNGGNAYKATVAGTTAASGGPTGTGSAIVDGTVTWAYQAKALLPADVMAMMAAIRTVSRLPLTMSRSMSDGFGWNDTTSMWSTVFNSVGGADFIDLHLYLNGITPGDPDFIISRANKPLLVGEFGASQADTTTVQAARFSAVAAIHNRPAVKGSFIWALADQKGSDLPADQWGVWDNTGYVAPAFPGASTAPLSITSGKRAVMTDKIPSFLIADRPEPFRATNLLSPTQEQAANLTTTATTGWLAGGNTYLYADVRGIGFSATAAGTSFIATSMLPQWRIPVTGGNYYHLQVPLLAGSVGRAVSASVDWYDAAGAYLSSSAAVTGTDHPTNPVILRSVTRAHTSAAFAVVVARVTDAAQAANEAHILLRRPARLLEPV